MTPFNGRKSTAHNRSGSYGYVYQSVGIGSGRLSFGIHYRTGRCAIYNTYFHSHRLIGNQGIAAVADYSLVTYFLRHRRSNCKNYRVND